MTETVGAVVPLKANSRRLPRKNFLYLDGMVLTHHIIRTLVGTPAVDKVYAFCSDPRIIELLPSEIVWLPRPQRLDDHAVSANQLFDEAVRQITEDIVILAQAPGPFVRQPTIERCIEAVRANERRTALTVQRHQTYAWFRETPLNFNPLNIEQTQQLEPVLTETSGLYAFRREFYIETGKRVSNDPVFIEVDDLEATDIDTAEDFKTAEIMATGRRPYEASSWINHESREGNSNRNQPQIRHISFNLDGVLLDSLDVMKRSWESAAQRNNLEIPFQKFREFIGIPFKERLLSLGVPASKHAALTSDYESTATLLSNDVLLVAGVQRGIEALKSNGYSISVMTSENRQWAMTMITKHLPGCIDAIVCGDDSLPRRGRPHPDPLLYACVYLEVDPCESLYIGDSLLDLQCANQAGVSYVHAAWGHGELDGLPRLWFDSFQSFIASLTKP